VGDIRATRRKLSDYKFDPRNPNAGSERGEHMIASSVSEFGAARSGVADKDGVIRAGNHTAEQLAAAGIEDVIEVETTGKEWVVVKRADMDEKTGRKYSVVDNRAPQFNEWDADVLMELTGESDLSDYFFEDELNELLAEIEADDPPGDPVAAFSRAEEWREKWQVEKGQLWLLGRHRILCGDSYSEEDRVRLLDGMTPDMLHTDPPYGINIVKPQGGSSTAAIGGAKPFGSTGETERRGKVAIAERNSGRTGAPGNRAIWDRPNGKVGGKKGDLVRKANVGRVNMIQSNLYPVIEGDDRPFDPTPFISLAPIVIMWGANYFAHCLPPSSGWIVWDKREDITRNDFADCEIAWSNLDKPARIFYHLWNGLHKGSQHGERRLHPTEKPVALFEEIGKMYADKGLWLDLFAGSGAQLVAAERSGATCYALECEPLWVATIIQRMADMGITPEAVR